MKIGVVGLGLIGGSFCKAIKEKTSHECFGMDINSEVIKKAISVSAIDKELEVKDLKNCDILIVSLYPKQTVSFLKENADNFKKGSIVIDACGVKSFITEQAENLLFEKGITFIGAHPMAGREFSGFDYSLADLFVGASFIMTPGDRVKESKIEIVKIFAKEIGFSRVVITDVKTHDETIAFTSQIAHIISNAYVKSPTLQNESGFSAGSFQDLSRVAKLNEDMWTDLFLLNQKPLLYELDTVIDNLSKYRKALSEKDAETLKKLLREGRILKENLPY